MFMVFDLISIQALSGFYTHPSIVAGPHGKDKEEDKIKDKNNRQRKILV